MSAARETPVSEYLSNITTRFIARCENFVAGRYWTLEVLFASVLFSALFSAGIDDRLWEVNNNHYYVAYFQKIEHPLFDVTKAYPPQSHEAKLNFRLTVPVLLHFAHWPPEQRWILPVLTAAAASGIIFLSCLFAFQVTHDRVCGLYLAMGVGCTHVGSFGFTMYYDAIAMVQLVAAMLPSLPWLLRGLLVFSAAFTDERALLAAPLLLAQPLCASSSRDPLLKRIASPSFLSVIGGMLAYLIGRFLLVKLAGLSEPLEGVGLSNIVNEAAFWHFGSWMALKGGWLLVLLAMLALWQQREQIPMIFFAIMTWVVVASGFLVEDIMRSTSYVFPSMLIAVTVLSHAETKQRLRIALLVAFVISAVAGNYNFWGSQITWSQPVAARMLAQFLRFVFHIISPTG